MAPPAPPDAVAADTFASMASNIAGYVVPLSVKLPPFCSDSDVVLDVFDTKMSGITMVPLLPLNTPVLFVLPLLEKLGNPMLILRISSMTNSGGTRIITSTMPRIRVRIDIAALDDDSLLVFAVCAIYRVFCDDYAHTRNTKAPPRRQTKKIIQPSRNSLQRS